jgi:hypothetical protein
MMKIEAVALALAWVFAIPGSAQAALSVAASIGEV